jgi:hypothetical protein
VAVNIRALASDSVSPLVTICLHLSPHGAEPLLQKSGLASLINRCQ